MCCFSRPIRHVERTRILARGLTDGRQRMAYQVVLGASEDLAMVLPLPVPPSPGDDAVRFIDLSGYTELFAQLDAAFPAFEPPLSRARAGAWKPASRAMLKVHQVGDFEASFVPRIEDFDRLDARFRLPGQVWDQLPVYADWGFAVFKLRLGNLSLAARAAVKLGLSRLGLRDFHPMAFEFPRRDPDELFLPTVHVHDGQVHARAEFAHQLYVQPARGLDISDDTWVASTRPIGEVVDIPRACGLLDADAPAWRRSMFGVHPNADVTVVDA